MAHPFHARIPLRWVDLDAQGHANNAALVDYFQEARVAFLLAGPHADLLGSSLLVSAQRAEYLGQIRFSADPLDVAVRVAQAGAASLLVTYEASQDGQPVGRGVTRLAHIDHATGRAARFTAHQRDWFAQQVVDTETVDPLPAYAIGEAHHTYPVYVRWSDVDAYRHANNTCFFVWNGEARIAMRESLSAGSMPGTGGQDETWMVVRQDLRHLGPVVHRLDPYALQTVVARTGRTSMTLAQQIIDPLDGAVLSRSTTIVVHGDGQGRPTPLPDEMRDAAARWPGEPLPGRLM